MSRRGFNTRNGRTARGRRTDLGDLFFQPGTRVDNFEVVNWGDSANDIVNRLRERMSNIGNSNVYIYTYGYGGNNTPDRNQGGNVQPQPAKPDPEKVLTVKNVNLNIATNGSGFYITSC